MKIVLNPFFYLFLCFLLFYSGRTLAANPTSSRGFKKVVYVKLPNVDGSINQSLYQSQILRDVIVGTLKKTEKFIVIDIDKDETREKIKTSNECNTNIEAAQCKALMEKYDVEHYITLDIRNIEGICDLIMKQINVNSQQVEKLQPYKSSCAENELRQNVIDLVYRLIQDEKITKNGTRNAHFDSDPPGAKVFLNEEFYGETPLDTKIPTGTLRLRIFKSDSDRYEAYTEKIPVDNLPETYTKEVNLSERTGFIKFDSIKPIGSSIFIDGKEIKDKDNKSYPVEIGKGHSVQVQYENYQTKIISIPELKPGEIYPLQINLSPSPCTIIITTSPPGADVYSNGEKIGNTSSTLIHEFPPGNIKLTIQKHMYETQVQPIVCEAAQKYERPYTLKWKEFSDEDQARIDNAKKLRNFSYIGFGITAAMGYLTYSKIQDFKKYDDQYKASTDPAQIETIKAQRDQSQKSATTFAIGTAVSIGASYLLYKLGDFPEDLSSRPPVVLLPTENGAKLAWQISW